MVRRAQAPRRAGPPARRATPGQTHERTHYTLTDAGRAALRAWLAEPSAFTRIQCEPIVRLLAAEYVDPEVLERSLAALREPLEESYAALDSRRGARAASCPTASAC